MIIARYLMTILWCIIMCCTPMVGRTEAAEATAFERAQLYYLSSLLSMASYSEELNLLVRAKMAEMGWEVSKFQSSDAVAETKAYIFRRALATGEPIYFLAVTGTESAKDAEVDLRLWRVPFGGSTPAEFAAYAKEPSAKNVPLAHQGFNDYTQRAFFTYSTDETDSRTLGEVIRDELMAHPEGKLYLTGHSLGGAVATLLAARLIDMGVAPEQLAVITFGAPAVGNATFAKTYGELINLERVTMSGDPVKAVLQSVSMGYVQFGDKIAWQQNRYLKRFPHEVIVYLDEALRHYYDVRETLPPAERQPKFFQGSRQKNGALYVVPLSFSLDKHLLDDEKYMNYAWQDRLQATWEKVIFAPTVASRDLAEHLTAAALAGCRYVLVADFTGKRVQQEEYNFRLTLEETLYDLTGAVTNYKVNSVTTNNLTPIEGMVYLHEIENIVP
ncbi:MAG: lipase family protein [Selenomonadaceae bacterium]|nr:lipase family protein [Selenomonadaceae bacterium]